MSFREIPLIPMGAITGKPAPELIRENLTAYRAAGITQYLLYPRSGCELEYLSDEWFDTCEVICSEAERLGFTSLWLYDEFNWPSGTCGKRVMKENPEFMMRQLSVRRCDDSYEIVSRRNPEMSDLLNPEVTDCFIRLTHEKYYARLGRYFGSLIKGFFTDEPEIGRFDRSHPEDVFYMPYYDGLEEEYSRVAGSVLREDILAGVKLNSEFFMETCNRLLADRFRRSFFDRIRDWCGRHGVVSTGHVMNEVWPLGALRSNGHALVTLSGLELPGIDEISTKGSVAGIEWLTLSTGMYAVEKRGNRGGMAELFALGPCDLSLTQLRRQIWLTAAFGMDRYLLATAQLEARGNIYKSGYFNSFTMDQPHMAVWNTWGEDAGRAAEFALKPRRCEFNIRYPYHHEPLAELLETMVRRQCAWRLLLPEEEPDPEAQFVLAFCNGKLHDEKSGANSYHFSQLYEQYLQVHLKRAAWVTDENGSLVEDVFVRCCADGSVLVIDLSGHERRLILHRGGTECAFELPACGVSDFPGWKVTLDRPNTMRTEFDGGIFEFEVDEHVTDLKLVLREFGGAVKAELDGMEISVDGDCTTLPPGFKGLYRETEINLTRGKHTLRLLNEAPYYPFLPRGFVTGGFTGHGAHIAPYRNDGAGVGGYVGTLTQRARIVVPVNAQKIRLAMTEGDAEILLDGHSLGIRAWAPYEWLVPGEFAGREVELTLLRHTTLGPLFGNKVYAGDSEEMRDKRQRLAPKNDCPVPGILEITWL